MEREKWSWVGKVAPNKDQRKVMLALLLREQVRVIVSNHLYQYGGQLYRQARDGPIGLTLTTVLARAITQRFSRLFKNALDMLNLMLFLNKLYVDDLNAAAMPIGREVSLAKRH